MSASHQLAEQNVPASDPDERTPYEGKGDTNASRTHELAARREDPFSRASGRFIRISRVAREEWAPSILIFVLDILTWMLFYGTASYLRDHGDAFSGPFQFAIIQVIQLVVIVQALFIIGGYSLRTETRGLAYAAEHILALLCAFGVSTLVIYGAATYDHSMKPSRFAVFSSFLVFIPASLFYRRWVRTHVTAEAASRAFLVLGCGQMASDFYHAYYSSPNNQGLEFIDSQGTRVGERIAGPGSPVIEGDLGAKLDNARRYSGIILADRAEHIPPDLLDRLIRTQFQRFRVYTLESFYEAHWRQVPAHSIDPFWPMQAGFQLSRASPYHYVKRMCDIVLSGVLLIIFSPLMIVIAGLIWLTNGRPIIFKQRRVGRDEEIFTAYKFRTMRSGSEGIRGTTGPQDIETTDRSEVREEDIYTRENDPRIFPVGRWLRKPRLDELPQLWNVFHGELSLIGPRAEWVECAQRYRDKIPFYHFRHLVKPGITGWAQVNYPYGESEKDAVQKLTYDLYYIRHYSLKLDAMILLKTIYTMFAGKGR